MIRIASAAALFLGLVLGAGAVWTWMALAQHPAPGPSSRTYAGADLTKVRPASLSTERLAQTLMSRVSQELVQVETPDQPMLGGAALYDQPSLAFQASRVNLVHSAKVISLVA